MPTRKSGICSRAFFTTGSPHRHAGKSMVIFFHFIFFPFLFLFSYFLVFFYQQISNIFRFTTLAISKLISKQLMKLIHFQPHFWLERLQFVFLLEILFKTDSRTAKMWQILKDVAVTFSFNLSCHYPHKRKTLNPFCILIQHREPTLRVLQVIVFNKTLSKQKCLLFFCKL